MAQEELTTLPVGRLGLVPLESCRSLRTESRRMARYSGVRSVSIQKQILSPLKDTKEIPMQSKFRTLVSVPEKVNV